MSRSISIIFLLIVLFFLTQTQTKFVKQSFPIRKIANNNYFQYVSKFAINIGQGNYKFRARFNRDLVGVTEPTTRVNVNIFLDEVWPEAYALTDCNDRFQKARVKNEIQIPNNGEWSEYLSGTLSQSIRTRVWFWALQDCNHNLGDANGKNRGTKLEVELTIINSDQEHFSADEKGFLWPYFLLMLFGGFVTFYGVNKCRLNYKSEDDFDWALLIVNLALFFQTLSFMFEFVHLLVYSSDGKGVFVIQLFGQLFNVAAQFTITCILILFSWGWTVNYMDLDSFDILIPFAILIGVIQMMIVGLGKIDDDEQSKYHQYDSWAGWVVLFLRLGMFAYFIYAIKDTLKKARDKVKHFVIQLCYFGSLYFLAFPFLMLLSSVFAPYLRHRVITIGTLLVQTLAMSVLIYLSTSKKTGYYQVSLKGQTLLPSNKAE